MPLLEQRLYVLRDRPSLSVPVGPSHDLWERNGCFFSVDPSDDRLEPLAYWNGCFETVAYITMTSVPLSSRNWFPKASAGLVLGLSLSLSFVGIFGLLCHASGDPRSPVSQYLMWLVAPVWAAVLGSCFLFRTGWRAWGILGGINVLLWTVYVGLRSTML